MNIAILGYGTVGSGVALIIEQAHTPFTKKLHVKHILIRKGKNKILSLSLIHISLISGN